MSLERKDLRVKLDHDVHQALQLLSDAHDVEMAGWAERVLVREVRRELHAAMMVAQRAQRLGISGIALDCSGSARDCAGSGGGMSGSARE